MLEKLGALLENSPMDRETKLAVIDLVARAPDSDLIRDLVELLKSWQTTDKMEQARFLRELEKIERTYRAEAAAVSKKGVKETLKLTEKAQIDGEVIVLREKIIFWKIYPCRYFMVAFLESPVKPPFIIHIYRTAINKNLKAAVRHIPYISDVHFKLVLALLNHLRRPVYY